MRSSFLSSTSRIIAGCAFLTILTIGSWIVESSAQISMETTPSWRSNDSNLFSTGAAWGDIDNDGYLELAISNGNDMDDDPNVIYDNDGGILETAYSWSSTNLDWSGKCSLGDIDKNGGLDLVVVNYGYPLGGGWAKRVDDVYMSTGSQIHPTPLWHSSPADSDNTFGLDLGDVDGDGDLDLATANGDAYTGQLIPTKVYLNNGTIFEEDPSWTSTELMASYDCQWADVDNDGDLDLGVINSDDPIQVYYNTGSGLETTASWTSAGSDDHNTMAWGDMNGDGWLDLAVSTNIQLGGSGKFKVYLNQGGVLSTTPSWQSNSGGYGSGIAWGDVDSDGDMDLAAGYWWGRSEIYENVDGWLEGSPAWQCSPSYSSVVETMAWGDVNNDGLRQILGESHEVDGVRKLFYLYHYPAHSFDSLFVDGVKLGVESYCFNLVSGWVSLATPPEESVEFYYTYSRDLDLAVSNWDRENYVFSNLNALTENVTLNLVPERRELAGGETLRYRVSVINNTNSAMEVTIGARVLLPGGGSYSGNPVYGPEVIDLQPYEIKDLNVSHVIPRAAPAGNYTYIFLVGIPPSNLLDRELFVFTVLGSMGVSENMF